MYMSGLTLFFTCAYTEVNEESRHVEEQGGEKQGEEVKAGLSVFEINNRAFQKCDVSMSYTTLGSRFIIWNREQIVQSYFLKINFIDEEVLHELSR